MKKVYCRGCEHKVKWDKNTVFPEYCIKESVEYNSCKLMQKKRPLRSNRLRYCRSFKPTFIYLIKDKAGKL